MSKHTKYALGESLKKILQKKPLNKITVTEIVNDCGVNRMTFYYHFHDIYDLLEWVCVKDAEKALEGKSYHSNWQEGLANLLSKVQENKEFVRRLSEKNPANRIGVPDDIKGTVLYLCSNASRYVIGQNIIVDGGWTIW